jgi:hypothetical protein
LEDEPFTIGKPEGSGERPFQNRIGMIWMRPRIEPAAGAAGKPGSARTQEPRNDGGSSSEAGNDGGSIGWGRKSSTPGA